MLLQERHTKLLRLARGKSAHSRLQRTSQSVRGEGGGGPERAPWSCLCPEGATPLLVGERCDRSDRTAEQHRVGRTCACRECEHPLLYAAARKPKLCGRTHWPNAEEYFRPVGDKREEDRGRGGTLSSRLTSIPLSKYFRTRGISPSQAASNILLSGSLDMWSGAKRAEVTRNRVRCRYSFLD
jgi:hypothetical protein